MLLLIHNAADLDSAIASASELLVHRRRRLAEVRDADELLGVWLRRARDGDLPWSVASAGVHESLSLMGIWSLCSVDDTSPSSMRPEERRRRILDSLSGPVISCAANETRPFIPVFDAVEAAESIDLTVRELRREYPHLIGGSWFVDHPVLGLVGPKGSSEASVGSTRVDRATHRMKKGTRL